MKKPKHKAKRVHDTHPLPPAKTEEGTNSINRIPRPLGFTYAIITMNKDIDINNKDNNLRKLRTRIIELWTRDNMQLNGKMVTINQMATYLNMNPVGLMQEMNRELIRIGNFLDDAQGKGFARALLIKGLNFCLENMAQSQSQSNMLVAQQGNKYVAFHTAETNRALANTANTQKYLQDWIKMLTDKNPENMYINRDKQFGNTGNKYITPDEANNMVQSHHSLMTSQEYLEAKEKELGALPDVNARNQDLTTIGIGLKKKTILLPAAATEVPIEGKKVPHESRRQRTENIIDIDEEEYRG